MPGSGIRRDTGYYGTKLGSDCERCVQAGSDAQGWSRLVPILEVTPVGRSRLDGSAPQIEAIRYYEIVTVNNNAKTKYGIH